MRQSWGAAPIHRDRDVVDPLDMKRNPESCKPSAIARAVTLGMCVLIAACGSTTESVAETPEALASSDAEVVDQAPESTVVEVVSESGTPLGGGDGEPTRVDDAGDSPSDSSTPTSSTTVPVESAPVVVLPIDLSGSVLNELGDLVVETTPDDPLNVRRGPGISYEIVDTLDHETGGVAATHTFVLESGTPWYYIAAPVEGWVHSGFVVPATPGCSSAIPIPDPADAKVHVVHDVDNDGVDDDVMLLVTAVDVDGRERFELAVVVAFANGESVSGEVGQGPVGFSPYHGIARISDMSKIQDGLDEIIVGVDGGASHGMYTVLTIEDCAIVNTTFGGEPVGFTDGASAGHSTTTGCAYGTGGRVEVAMTSVNFNEESFSIITFELEGTEWAELELYEQDSFPASGVPSQLTLIDCV